MVEKFKEIIVAENFTNWEKIYIYRWKKPREFPKKEIHTKIYVNFWKLKTKVQWLRWFNCCLVTKSCPTLLQTHGLKLARCFCPWDFPGKNTGVGCHFLLQGIFLTQESNLHLLNCRWILSHWGTREALYIHIHKNVFHWKLQTAGHHFDHSSLNTDASSELWAAVGCVHRPGTQ